MSRRVVATFALAAAMAVSTISGGPASAGTGSKTPFPDTFAAARAAAQDILKQTGATSISMALVDGTRTVWSTSVGVVDGAGTKPTPSTLYGIGSVSKMLTAIAVMQLVDAGKVSLDAPVTDYVTDFRMASPEYRQITARMLLDHSAGLPGTDNSNGVTVVPFPGYAQQVLDSLTTSRLKTTPGSMSVYCNDCFTLAGILVQRMSGLPFTDYVQQRILMPLGMDVSRYATTPLTPGSYAPVLTATGALPAEITNIQASGGMLSTPDDLGRLAAMLLNHGTVDGVRILSPQAVKEMGRSQLPTTMTAGPPSFRYGLGWDSVTEPGLVAAGVDGWVKGGDTLQYHASFTLAPTEKVGAMVLGAGTTISSTALEALAQRMVLSALVEKGAMDGLPEPLTGSAPERAAPTAAQTANIAGIYLAQDAAYRVTTDRDGAVTLATYAGGQWVDQPQRFTMRSDGRYWPRGPAASPLSLSRGWGRTFLVINKVGGLGHYREDVILGQKATSVNALSSAWQRRVGETWVMVNERADSVFWSELPTLNVAELPGLSGYLWVDNMLAPSPVDPVPSDDVASMFLTVPILQGRDLSDLVILHRADGEWMRFAGWVYRPLSSVPSMTVGTSDVTIGPEGYAEWRTLPAAGTVAISGNGNWKMFTANGAAAGEGVTNGAEVPVPAGARIALLGAGGATLEVRYAA